MEVTREEIMNAVLGNDVDRVAEILEGFHLVRGGTAVPYFTSTDKEVVVNVLGFASTMDWSTGLPKTLARDIIEHTAAIVNTFQFLRLIMSATRIGKMDDFSIIPEEICTALSGGSYNDEIAYAIETLDDEEFCALIALLVIGGVKQIDIKFNLPILRRIYEGAMIPACLMFAYMGLCLRQANDES